jgi:hypothetical protein
LPFFNAGAAGVGATDRLDDGVRAQFSAAGFAAEKLLELKLQPTRGCGFRACRLRLVAPQKRQ